MRKYIDVDAMKKLLQNLAHDDWNQITCTTWAEAFEEVADMIDGTPTADVVEIVRCKDCKHNPKYEWFTCPAAGLNEKQRPETAWCWKGERKEEEDDND